ncbi:uncharacterized protein EV422DRAFT_495830 [Fimicolochytrium jonesii]|uniref:uncharacterized protein n=1 Tax=Fimicolochytrium jonesii TaxID=1396493 RepID=UPI0022FDDEDE|nr:uncharacterized protein EV422DRAFT_495830 [Fimicolochytrium jonesii]KAI8821405.1 hypothetical protein EV422DRAFT_495830 [Fimicolochytrium jonesii]
MNTGQQQQQPESQNIFKQSRYEDALGIRITLPVFTFASDSHPVALMFHLAFRVGAIVTYLLCSSIVSSDVLCIVLIVLLLAFDFWTVKNVTGRLLVGLRWWNEVREDGTSEWVFESRENRLVNAVDSRVFWFTLYITPVIWILFALLCLIYLKLLWLVVTIVAVTMNSANLFGYTKCEKVLGCASLWRFSHR